jgi:DNA-binding transcriptional regulator LsrR (DeoR family)
MNARPPTPETPAPAAREESLLMFRVATKHFQDRLSKLEIAGDLGISRFRVARLLEQAVNSGVVDIRVAFPAIVDDELSSTVAAMYGLLSAKVLIDDGDDSWRAHGIAALAIHHVGDLLHEGASLGLAWGRTLNAVERTGAHLRLTLPKSDVVQLVGGVPSTTGSLDASDLVRRFSLLTGGNSIVLNAPLIVPTPDVVRGLRAERSVAATLAAGRSADVALFAVGSWQPGQSHLWEMLTESDRLAAKESGVVADACGILFARSGVELTTDLSDRFVGIDPASLRQIPRRVGVVIGTRRTMALSAVLRSGMITDLVIEASVARELLALS